jgi:hypothetical protein
VVDVIFDPDSLTPEDKTRLKQMVGNPEFVDIMPPNSIIGRNITNSHNLTDMTPYVFLPFFSSHIQLPVQAGEQVNIIYDDYSSHGTSLGKWITRVSEGNQVEDLNYTHGDRRYDPQLFALDPTTAQQANNTNNTNEDTAPTFPNGGGTSTTYTLQQQGRDNPYDTIMNMSKSSKFATFEPVPRWIKRPQELTIQGMNNSLIVLGEDRTGPALRVSGSDQVDKTGYAGTIDIVCGRGRGGIPYDTTVTPDPSNEKTGTSPAVIRNSRRKLETNKFARRRQNIRRNKNEGNPDFKRDAARIYVSMNTAGDKNFKTQHSTNTQEGFQYPDNTIRPTQNATVEGGIGNSYIVLKADHLRVVGRKESNPTINGSILFLREGVKDDDLSYIFLEGGKLQLEAKEMFFGKSVQKQEPYIKWTVYKEHIDALKEQIKALADQVQLITNNYNTAFAASIATPFSPIASLVSTGPATLTNTTTKVADITAKLNLIDAAKAKSTKIFGE